MFRVAILLPLLAVVAVAKPPASQDFKRIDAFNRELASRFQKFKDAEEFKQKPLPEKLVIKWSEVRSSLSQALSRLTGAL